MAVDSKVAGKPYKGNDTPGRKSRDGSEAVIKIETLQTRMDDLVALKIKASQAADEYSTAVKAVAEASGLLSVTVNKIVRSKANNSYIEDRTKAKQLALVFDECKEFAGVDSNDDDEDDDDEDDEDDEDIDRKPPPAKGGRRRGSNRVGVVE